MLTPKWGHMGKQFVGNVMPLCAELIDGPAARATDEELLQLLKIDAVPAKVDIRRHNSGYVVIRHNP